MSDGYFGPGAANPKISFVVPSPADSVRMRDGILLLGNDLPPTPEWVLAYGVPGVGLNLRGGGLDSIRHSDGSNWKDAPRSQPQNRPVVNTLSGGPHQISGSV